MTTEVQPRLSLREKADILRDNGVDVIQCIEAGSMGFYPFPTVYFNGDEDEGRRAVELMHEHDILIFKLQREWYFGGAGDYHDIRWSILFARAGPSP